MAKQQFIEAGKITNTHGINGQIKIEVYLDSPEYLKSFNKIYVNNTAYCITSSFVQKNFLVAKLEDINDINEAMILKGKIAFINRDDANLNPNDYFLCDVIGCSVIDQSGTNIGTIVDILDNPAAPIFVVKGDSEHLIPSNKEYIMSTDFDNNIVNVNIPEGL